MGNFGLFIGNVANHWVFLMGGIAGVVLSFVNQIKTTPWRNGLWIAALICLIASCDRAWQDEHRNSQIVIGDKAAISAAYGECHTSAKMREAYTLGLEKNSLSSRETIDRQQGMSDKQANDISACLLYMGKMNPKVHEEVNVITVPLIQVREVSYSEIFFTTNEIGQRFHGVIQCASDFKPIGYPQIVTASEKGTSLETPPIKISNRDWEIGTASLGPSWSPSRPAYLSISSEVPMKQDSCTFSRRD